MKITGKLLQQGPLRYYATADMTVLAATPRGKFKLFRLLFGKDGSIYLPFPYLEAKRGVLAEVDPSSEPDPKTLDLRRTGVVVEEDVKFAHHSTGSVHFSKTKGTKEQALTLPGRSSFALSGEGRVFDLRFYWTLGLTTYDELKPGRTLPLIIPFSEHPTGLRVWGMWRRKSWLLASRENESMVVGPQHVGTNRATGARESFVFLGQPADFPHQEHLLLISYGIEPAPTGADVPTMLFWGGHDAQDDGTPTTTKMLAFMYPCNGPGQAARQ